MSGAPLRLLIVEDEAPLRAVYHSLLKDPSLEGRFDILMAENSRAANKALKKKLPDIVVLDWNLPDGSGLEILDVIRCSPGGRQVQVFVVTGLSGNDRQVEALRSGADDYLAKPFDPSVLITRLLNLARRLDREPPPTETLSIEDLRLELPVGKVKSGRKTEELHRKEADILRVFMKRPNMIHSGDYLWEVVWGYSSAHFKHTLQVTISNLRRKLDPKWAERLQSVKDQGYILRLG